MRLGRTVSFEDATAWLLVGHDLVAFEGSCWRRARPHSSARCGWSLSAEPRIRDYWGAGADARRGRPGVLLAHISEYVTAIFGPDAGGQPRTFGRAPRCGAHRL